MWRKRNPVALLVEVQTGTATMGNRMAVPQKVKNKTNNPRVALLHIYPDMTNTPIQRDTCTHVFTTALFAIISLSVHVDGLVNKKWCVYIYIYLYIYTHTHIDIYIHTHTHNGILFSH